MSPTNWLDERIRLGEVPEHAAGKAADRADSEAGRRAQAQLELSDASILERLPPERLAARIRSRLEAKSAPRAVAWRAPRFLVPALATLVASAMLAPRMADHLLGPGEAPVARTTPTLPDAPSTEPATAATAPATSIATARDATRDAMAAAETQDDGIRLRGAGELALFAVAPDGSTSPCGKSVAAGSTLRVVTPRSSSAAVWSIDETGAIQRHWPLDGDSSTALAAGPLPRDWETDPSAGWERFVLVESSGAFSLARVEAHLRGLVGSHRARDGRIVLPGGLATSSATVERASR